jgi:hypothetical protein
MVHEEIKHAGEFLWSISLDVECPHCLEDFDANITDDFFEEIQGVEVCQAKKGVNVNCPKCGELFKFDIGNGC